MKISPFPYAEAFKKNCPKVRMTKAEFDELERLIRVAIEEGIKYGRSQLETKP